MIYGQNFKLLWADQRSVSVAFPGILHFSRYAIFG